MNALFRMLILLLLAVGLAGCFTTRPGPYHRDDGERYEQCRRDNPDNPELCRDRYPRGRHHMRGY